MVDFFQEEYVKLKWERWEYMSGDLKSLRRVRPPIPPRHGVYIFRAPHPICRVCGSSDVMYIGQSGGGKRGGRQGIGPGNGGPGRLFNTRGPDEWVRERIEEQHIGELFAVECAFIDEGDPEEVEKRLLRGYLKTHYELPPANHKSARLV